MRCTKCHYLSFEPEARCRNCGHDLSIDDLRMPDLPLTDPEPDDDPLADFDLAEAPIAGLGTATAVLAPPRSSAATAVALAPARVTSELPLFVREMPDDEAPDPEPMVRVPSRPRAPIAVRKTTPDPARLRAKYAMPVPHERDLLDEADAVVASPRMTPVPPPRWISEPTPDPQPAVWPQPVAARTRLAAAAIDAAVLGTIGAVITALTLRMVNVPIGGFGLLAAVPLAGFVLLIAAGYLLMFTAAQGQTLGKMAMGIRVVGTSLDAGITDRVTLSQAAVRAVAALPSVLVLGAGFIPALVGPGLAVHDRIAHTRVVRL
ncbi:MAG: RDD family protein [Acidobacteria bacterium]|nr:RDD family protein [Acidobacteriota bacterium]